MTPLKGIIHNLHVISSNLDDLLDNVRDCSATIDWVGGSNLDSGELYGEIKKLSALVESLECPDCGSRLLDERIGGNGRVVCFQCKEVK